MPRQLTAATVSASTAAIAAPRYRMEMVLPSGTIDATTGDPARVATLTLTHLNMQVGDISGEAVAVQINLADPTLIADVLSASLKGSTLKVWKYYEFAGGALVQPGDMVSKFEGIVRRARGPDRTATLEFTYPGGRYPGTRINASGGFPMLSRPGIVVLNGQTVVIRRGGLL